jgi:hypothetical protein
LSQNYAKNQYIQATRLFFFTISKLNRTSCAFVAVSVAEKVQQGSNSLYVQLSQKQKSLLRKDAQQAVFR